MTENLFITRFPVISQKLMAWWNHEDQADPCLLFTLPPAEEALIEPADLVQWWTDINFIIDYRMRFMDQQRYLGEAVPFHYIDMGSSAMAGVLGADMRFIDRETVWAYPCFSTVEEVAEVVVDRTNQWYQIAREMTLRSAARAKGHHFVSHFALGGITDIVAGLYGTENLLVDLLEKPEAVARAMDHIKRTWISLFEEFNLLLEQTGNAGGIGWAGIWAPGTTFPLQEDFSYMISNRMYRKFVVPHLRDMIDAMEYPFYHLDGTGAIPHLDTLLQIPRLKVIQWVPGAGKERLNQWYPLIKRIIDAGKSIEVFAEANEVDDLVVNVGRRGLLISVRATEDEAYQLLEKYHG